MRISLLCSNNKHPVFPYLKKWAEDMRSTHHVELVEDKVNLSGGELLLLVSCSQIVDASDRAAYRTCLVIHASDLPHGRGWSPHVWQLLEGAEFITLSILEAEDQVDSGRIWRKLKFPVPKHALWDEINKRLFEAEIELINFAVSAFENIVPTEQDISNRPSYYRRRIPADSEIDPIKSIASQFNKIRVCDPYRFPAFFELHGHKYKLILEKFDD
jgi:methionyl-tRNA formyltransferase